MPVSRGLPSVTADADHRTVTLGQLRDLVAAADGMSADLIVRGKAIPFHWPDAGHPLGSRMMALALDEDHDSGADDPQRDLARDMVNNLFGGNREQRRKRGKPGRS